MLLFISPTFAIGANAICSPPPSDFNIMGTIHLLPCIILAASSTGMVAVDFTVAELAARGVLVNIVPVGPAEKLAILVVDDTGVRVMGLLDMAVVIGVVAARMVCLGGVDVTSVV